MTFFESNNKTACVKLDEDIIQHLRHNISTSFPKETGGILVGYYNEGLNVANITSITGPPPDSKSGFSWFIRGVSGLLNLLRKEWKAGNYYLGEWHFHPNAEPIPSTTDIIRMKSIATSSKYNCPEPLLLIIGGNSDKYKIRLFLLKGKLHELKTEKCTL